MTEKSLVELTCEKMLEIGGNVTAKQLSKALELPPQSARDRLKNGQSCGWVESVGTTPQSYVVAAAYFERTRAQAKLAELKDDGALFDFVTKHERAAAAIHALENCGIREVMIALGTNSGGAYAALKVAKERGWVVVVSERGIQKYEATPKWIGYADDLRRAKEPGERAPVEALKIEYVGRPSITGPLAGTIWRACFAVAA